MGAEEGILASIEFQMSLLLFVALAGYLIAHRINQSAVVGIIFAGIIVGPSLLGLVTYTEFVASLGHLGAVVLLFTIGLHFRIQEIANPKYLGIALFGIVVPWVSGYFLAGAFDYDFGAAIFIGTALTATSIAITANVLREMGKLGSNAAKAIIGAAIIDDVLSLLVLSVSQEIVSGTLSVSFIFITIAKAVAFLVIGIYLGKTVISRLMARLDTTKLCNKFPEAIFIFAMMVAFLYGMVAEYIGLSAIIGSFLAGVSLARVRLKHGANFRDGAEHLQVIFASIFFISLGVLLDFHVITLDLLWFVLVLSVVAIATKFIGCGLPAKFAGLSLRDATTVGVGMVPRGEVAMIVALIGLNHELISQNTYAALVLMSLITTVIPPIIMRNWLFREPKEKESDKNKSGKEPAHTVQDIMQKGEAKNE